MKHHCRFCNAELNHSIIDLGFQPPSNAYIPLKRVNECESYLPLETFVCTKCWLVQIPKYAPPEHLFNDEYAYFSSTSASWNQHAKNYVDMIVDKLKLHQNSQVVELASNDGYLLKNFVEKSIPCLGIEPTASTANVAISRGISTLQKFFGVSLAEELRSSNSQVSKGADLVIANNVLAHVPDINDFVRGISILLNEHGTVTFEFPHLLNLLQFFQFDTIYHEHYSYLSLKVVERICAKHNLYVYDVEQLPTHGGSLRVYASKNGRSASINVDHIKSLEDNFLNCGIEDNNLLPYKQLKSTALEIKYNLLSLLIQLKKDGKTVVGYGAAAKGNTLLNYCGIKQDLLPCIADKAKSKQNQLMPGSRIPVVSPETIEEMHPDFVLVLPWNLIDEIKAEFPNYKLITAIPNIKFWNQ